MVETKLTKDEFTKEFNKLFENKPIVIFGGGEIGRRAVLRMEYLGIKDKIVCIGDNNPDKAGQVIEDIPVMTKQQIKEKYPDVRIAITVGNDDVAGEIRNDLEAMGFDDFISRQALLHRFEYDHHREKALVYQNGKYIMRQIVVCVTERCTLRCKNCSQYMPKFKAPKDLDTNVVIESIRNLTDAITYLQDLTLLGGEPLMNKELPRICEAVGELKKKGKIKNINIVSNGTIIPGNDLLDVMNKYGIMIMLSDYGKLSVNMDRVQKACEEKKVQWRYAYLGGKNEVKIQYWSEVGELEDKGYSEEYAVEKFKNCNSVYDCNTLYRGRHFFCSQAAFMSGLGIIDPEKNGYNLLDETMTKEERIIAFRKYMDDEVPIEACHYCDMHGQVPAAEQL
ncbi:radical SAM protein [Butyrivibrio sp. INlla16]|uniref:radical SAM protein n=1 Tax=Butyrivibrio sp. INlla16 TaxID=1520807 RepID=UPI0008876CE5|nr:radical SAM protein [Butyrivibrio sp. INlla16]SDB60287.1 Radical SAM superfamily protein [Butyrivibrio sp. INlla16]